MRGFADETLHNQAYSEEAALYAELVVRFLVREIPSRATETNGDSVLRARLAGLWLEVAEDLGRAWTVPELAAKVNLSERHFYRRVHEIYGESPVQILRRLRLDRARELIRAGEYSVQQTAAAVGYQDYFAFLSAFKKHTGMTTSDYRNSVALWPQKAEE
jgi:AraC-like DNA-binding protein